ncbi:flavodoxin domain-containing protein [Paraflavisolibacter caeni]|uniref:flavodoxin domain-containing protein n=1 Tax=Paraflavisolibacter caeni TaxID=2982496 RepID=UPI003C6E549D
MYSSIDGQTQKICQRLKDILVDAHHSVDLVTIDNQVNDISLYDKVVLASSIRYGKHNWKIGG